VLLADRILASGGRVDLVEFVSWSSPMFLRPRVSMAASRARELDSFA